MRVLLSVLIVIGCGVEPPADSPVEVGNTEAEKTIEPTPEPINPVEPILEPEPINPVEPILEPEPINPVEPEPDPEPVDPFEGLTPVVAGVTTEYYDGDRLIYRDNYRGGGLQFVGYNLDGTVKYWTCTYTNGNYERSDIGGIDGYYNSQDTLVYLRLSGSSLREYLPGGGTVYLDTDTDQLLNTFLGTDHF
jgi:hypothetical protein